jgi:hypothetical protein
VRGKSIRGRHSFRAYFHNKGLARKIAIIIKGVRLEQMEPEGEIEIFEVPY